MIFELVRDFTDVLEAMPPVHPKRRILGLLDEAIRRDVHFIDRHPTTLFQCLWNTCWWYDCPEAADHYLEPEAEGTPSPPWARHGEKVCRLLERWRHLKERCTPGFVWLRSHRPSPHSLGTRLQGVLGGHAGAVRSITFSPDGKWLAGSSGDTVRLWDVHSGVLHWEMVRPGALVYDVAFSPDGQRLASVACGGTNDTELVDLWHIASRCRALSLVGFATQVLSISFSPDGRRLAAACVDGRIPVLDAPAMVRVWDTETGAALLSIPDADGALQTVAFSPDGTRLAGGSTTQPVRVWHADTGRVEHALPDCTRSAFRVAFSPDGARLATSLPKGVVRIWDTETWEELQCLTGHQGNVFAAAFSPDGQTLVSGSEHGDVLLRDVACGNRIDLLQGHEFVVWSAAFSPDGNYVATGGQDHFVLLWHAGRSDAVLRLRGHAAMILGYRISADGRFLATMSLDQTVRVWDLRSCVEIGCMAGDSVAHSAAFAPDGCRLATRWERGVTRIWASDSQTEISSVGQEDVIRHCFADATGDNPCAVSAACTGPYQFVRDVPITEVCDQTTGSAAGWTPVAVDQVATLAGGSTFLGVPRGSSQYYVYTVEPAEARSEITDLTTRDEAGLADEQGPAKQAFLE
jgi:WD40 repeat protein